MIYKWWNYFGLSLGLYWLKWFLCYDHMSIKKLHSNAKTIGIFETVKEKKKLKRFSAVLFLFSKWNILQLSKITKQKFITNISAWTCKTFTMPARHRQGHCFMTCLPIQKKYLVAWTERAGFTSPKDIPIGMVPFHEIEQCFLSVSETNYTSSEQSLFWAATWHSTLLVRELNSSPKRVSWEVHRWIVIC